MCSGEINDKSGRVSGNSVGHFQVEIWYPRPMMRRLLLSCTVVYCHVPRRFTWIITTWFRIGTSFYSLLCYNHTDYNNWEQISTGWLSLMMEALGSSETSVLTRHTLRNIPKDGIFLSVFLYIKPERCVLHQVWIYVSCVSDVSRLDYVTEINMFPVRYELGCYIIFERISVFEWLICGWNAEQGQWIHADGWTIILWLMIVPVKV
jgi:hypothetical protein